MTRALSTLTLCLVLLPACVTTSRTVRPAPTPTSDSDPERRETDCPCDCLESSPGVEPVVLQPIDEPTALRMLCSLDHPPSCYRAGLLERGFRGDATARVAQYFEHACVLGHSLACAELGLMQVEGLIQVYDRATLTALLEAGCEAGNPSACLNARRLLSQDQSRGATVQ